MVLLILKMTIYFNSRPCGRGDFYADGIVFFVKISIHAPAGGATVRQKAIRGGFKFQFTPLREGRLCPPPRYDLKKSFQFTPLREGRPTARRLPITRIKISIHAPAGGATQTAQRWAGVRNYFNSRPCGRGDGRGRSWVSEPHEFQFTPLREGRLPLLPLYKIVNTISIHAPAGGATINPEIKIATQSISIHAPAGGATKLLTDVSYLSIISIHAPAGGATVTIHIENTYFLISIHAPAGGATRLAAPARRTLHQFQFTPLREGRHAFRGSQPWSF